MDTQVLPFRTATLVGKLGQRDLLPDVNGVETSEKDQISYDPSAAASNQFPQLSSQESINSSSITSSSITDSDSMASFSESEQGSLTDNFSGLTAFSTSKKSRNHLSKSEKDSPEVRQGHNMSEQFRRKYLKSCFDNLQKEVVVENTPKASHLLILTSALDVVKQVKDREQQLRRDQDRLLSEQRREEHRLDEVIKDLQASNSDLDFDQVLAQLDCGPDGFPAGSILDRSDLFHIGEAVEVVAQSSRKRSHHAVTAGDAAEESENSEQPPLRKHSKLSPAALTVNGVGKKSVKKSRGKTAASADDRSAESGSSIKSEDLITGSIPVGVLPVKRTFLPLRLIDEPDDGSSAVDPDMPLPVSNHRLVALPRKRETLSMAERRKLATENGLPIHLAGGIPTLPGGNYWSQSLLALPMLLRTSRAPLWDKRVELTTEPPKKALSLNGLLARGGRPLPGRHSAARDRHGH
ncbi:hypothetical protein BV898_13509 [Hypsibius exemplaris]|uniref:BHLH domain-containing protein n=1 Tax=Hypsibius exemplaris TaxID=2072580 RepID=A0A1W0WAP7_HYPEX|nr:hypothetical protein BV898_13509 [Hypsibius exemplaris]